ncbi:MAG: DUF512 domain-containing protein [Lachnospiraceae bacterium]|jgi:putative radical SAM enzyme (TIGR03279 family)|nr:DUF512 domain-containing protein [Lachnospiraceae bacterium]
MARNRQEGHLIREVAAGSIGEELGLEAGDRLLSIDGQPVEDVFDYQYLLGAETALVEVEKADGELWELDIEHGGDDLGLIFDNGLMSEYRPCANRCIFCFIDQLPKGMRETLYFKDDDARLSFLQGNYVTLTNWKKRDLERVLLFRPSPINISVHTTNPQLRCRMLGNRFAGKSLEMMDALYGAGIPMNGQIVLCKGINDGAELERTVADLGRYIPVMGSLSVVPVGLTRFREGLAALEPFAGADAAAVIEVVERFQGAFMEAHGTHFVHASDEFYLLAGRDMPAADNYDGYPQLENGVGMVRLLTDEVEEALGEMGVQPPDTVSRTELSMAVGYSIFETICRLAGQILNQGAFAPCAAAPVRCLDCANTDAPADKTTMHEHHVIENASTRLHIYPIRNDFFGESITVTGLLTGQDLAAQLKGKPLGARLLLSSHMFRSGEETLLDDMTRGDLENALGVPVEIVGPSGDALVRALVRSH